MLGIPKRPTLKDDAGESPILSRLPHPTPTRWVSSSHVESISVLRASILNSKLDSRTSHPPQSCSRRVGTAQVSITPNKIINPPHMLRVAFTMAGNLRTRRASEGAAVVEVI